MIVGILKEGQSLEQRVALTPAGVQSLVAAGHTVYVQQQAGEQARFVDEEYRTAGAAIAFSAEEVVQRADLVLKVSPPTEELLLTLKPGQLFFSFHHLGVARRRTLEILMEKKVTSVAYELIENARGDMTVLQTMSEIAGQVSMQIAAHYLQAKEGGRGILLGSVPGVAPASVVILGAGTVGRTAARVALGMGASVTVLDKDLARLRDLENLYQWRIATGIASPYNVARALRHADVVIGAVLLKAEKAPHLVTEAMVKEMKAGSVILDISIDQGGCVETSRPTTLDDPVFVRYDVIHYCVPNIPSSVARTSTVALTNVLLPYIMAVAELGIERALAEDVGFSRGVLTYDGECANKHIANAFGFKAVDIRRKLGALVESQRN